MGKTVVHDRSRFAAERSRARSRGLVYLGGIHGSLPVSDVLAHIAIERASLDAIEEEAVLVGRGEGLSWDRLSGLLGGRPTGEGLRLRYPNL